MCQGSVGGGSVGGGSVSAKETEIGKRVITSRVRVVQKVLGSNMAPTNSGSLEMSGTVVGAAILVPEAEVSVTGTVSGGDTRALTAMSEISNATSLGGGNGVDNTHEPKRTSALLADQLNPDFMGGTAGATDIFSDDGIVPTKGVVPSVGNTRTVSYSAQEGARRMELEEALAWHAQLVGAAVDEQEISRSDTAPQNTVINPGRLRDHWPMWSYMITALREYQDTHSGPLEDGWWRLDYDQISSIILEGLRFEFNDLGTPPRWSKGNYIPPGHQSVWFLNQVLEMVKMNIVVEVEASEAWMIHACFLVPKSNGGWRICMDLRELNKYLDTTKFSLCSLNKCRYAYFDLAGSDVDDLSSGYQHVNVHPDFQKYLGFRAGGRTFLMRWPGFGLNILPYIFQSIASVPVRFNMLVGVSHKLCTAEDWSKVATGALKLPSPGNRASIFIHLFLDDFNKKYKSLMRTKDRKVVPAKILPSRIIAWSASFTALLKACGFVTSAKSSSNPFAVNTFLGFNIEHELGGGCFGIPLKKRQKNIAVFKEALSLPSWSFRYTAALSSRILQFKLIWGNDASTLAQPLYSHLAREMKLSSTWDSALVPCALDKEMVHEALALLDGPTPLLRAPVLDRFAECIRMWEEGNWKAFRDSNGNDPNILFGDSAEVKGGAYMTSLPMDIAVSGLEHDIVKNHKHLSFWKALSIDEKVAAIIQGDDLIFFAGMTEEEIKGSSTYREMLVIAKLYADPAAHARIVGMMESSGRKSLLHATDSQAVRSILHRGRSCVPIIHELVLSIRKTTRLLRTKYGLFFGWVRRNHPHAEVADAFSKLAGWQIDKKRFEVLHQKFNFTLDAFAAVDEVVHDTKGEALPFCSRAISARSLGDARCTPWKTDDTVWCFPPPKVEFLVEEAMRRCASHPGVSLLVVPGWLYAKMKTRLLSLPFSKYGTLPRRSCFQRKGLVHGTHTENIKWGDFLLYVFEFGT